MSTKYPLLLVHGIILKDVGFFKAFGRIEASLKEAGYTVFTSQIDGLGTIETNSRQLKEQIEEILKKTNSEKINLIAHSKGGLDSRHMIEAFRMEDKIASLTTLSTPHKGSPIATTLLGLPTWMLKFISFWLNTCYRIFGDKNPDAFTVCRQLALVENIEETSLRVPETIYCQSFSTTLEKSTDDFIMGIPLIFSHRYKNEDSDGLVSADSSKFGNYRGSCVEGSVSHREIVDITAKKEMSEKIRSFYVSLCQELSQMGF